MLTSNKFPQDQFGSNLKIALVKYYRKLRQREGRRGERRKERDEGERHKGD